MQNLPDRAAFPAFFRMMQARVGLGGVAVFAWRPGAFRPWAASPELQAALPAPRNPDTANAWQLLPPPLGRALGEGRAARVDPGALGLAGDFAALLPIGEPEAGAHFLLVHDARPRRLTAALREGLADGAALLRPLVARRSWHSPRATALTRPALEDAGESPLRGAILPRTAAHQLIETALHAPGASGRLAIFMIGLDRFSAVNEALGVAAGDALLAVTGARLERAIGRDDRLVRLEGDKFLVLGASAGAHATAFADRMIEAIGQPLTLAGRTIVMQASIGIVTAGEADRAAPALLLQADTAMRRAKAEGRNRFALHEARLDAANLEKSRLELDLSNAPANGQLHLSYQPFVDLATGAVTGVEALMRWRHPTRGEVQPSTFIPLAEATGLILPLGNWALRTACQQAVRWPSSLALAVNISALQFHQPGFEAEVDAALAETGFPPERLELEITETVLMRDNPATIAQLEALIARGIRIALDDFGTGYSALAYLARLPHHRIKLDKSFVQDLGNPATAELIRAIIAQARANGVGITAEGVERPEHLAQVRAMGFTHAQGFITGAPTADPTQFLPEPIGAQFGASAS